MKAMSDKTKSETKYYGITYKKKRIKIPYPRNIRTGKCVACKRSKDKGEIKVTAMHHTKYEFSITEVLKNKFLALKNTLELCFSCHQIADGFRGILTIGSSDKLWHVSRMLKVAKLLPIEQQVHLEHFCRLFIEWREKVGKLVIDD